MKIAVLGAGNGGMAMAAHLVLKGNIVSLYDKYPQALQGIKKAGGISLQGAIGKSFTPLSTVSTDMREVITGVTLIMVVTPAFAHRDIAQTIAPILDDSQIIVLHPGRTGGALEFSYVIKANNPDLKPIIAEAQTLLYASRRTDEAEVTIYGIKKQVGFATLPAQANQYVQNKLQQIFTQFAPKANILETSLLNIGAIFHPTPAMLNAARIEGTKGDFEYYHEGITPGVGNVLEKIDQERMMIAEVLGVATKSAVEWLKDVYGAEGVDIYSSVQANSIYGGIKAPNSLDTRYISEDVPMSLVPIAELGKLAGVETPAINTMIDLANILHKTNYRREGRTLEKLGLRGMSIQQVLELVS